MERMRWRVSSRPAGLLAACCALAACGGDERAASIEVVVSEAPPGLPSRIERIELRVSRPASGEPSQLYASPAGYDGARLRPYSVSVSPREASDPGRVVYTFEATGLSGGVPYVVTRARLVFLPGARLTLPLRLAADCVEVACAPTETCRDGACAPAEVDPCTLEGAALSSRCDRDRPVDAAEDPALDARVDTSVPDGRDAGAADGAPGDARRDATVDAATTDTGPVGPPTDASPAADTGPPPGDAATPGCTNAGDCDDGDLCTTDRCTGGSCQWTPVSCDDRVACTNDRCVASTGACTHDAAPGSCYIDGACLGPGALDPGNECRECRPSRDRTGWSDRPAGAACTADGLDCTADACDGAGSCVAGAVVGGCLIDGACRAAGEVSPTNECRLCDPAVSTTTWSPVEDGSTCGGTRFCCRGACLGCGAMHCGACGERCIGVDIWCNPSSCACEPL